MSSSSSVCGFSRKPVTRPVSSQRMTPKELASFRSTGMATKMSYQDKSNVIRWVDQENYHITLAFLGDQEQPSLENLAEQLDYSLQQSQSQISLSHAQPFPESRPKLVAAMVERCDVCRSRRSRCT